MQTRLCDVLGIEHPVIQASLGPWTSIALSAAVSNAGGLGSIGTALMSVERVREMIAEMNELTDRPYAVNHTMRPFVEETFAATLDARPKLISMAIGHRTDIVQRTHDAGVLFMQQVHTVEQAVAAAESGVDVIIAQGGEAGGFSGSVSIMALLPQVVRAVDPVPVVAAGGIADGIGLAAALMLGAAGVNIGTRFLASEEANVSAAWKQRIVDASSEDAIKVEFAPAVFPPTGEGGYETLPRALSTAWIEAANADPDMVQRERERLSAELVDAVRGGRADELVPFTGATAGMIGDVLPAGEIVTRMVRDAEEALARAPQLAV